MYKDEQKLPSTAKTSYHLPYELYNSSTCSNNIEYALFYDHRSWIFCTSPMTKKDRFLQFRNPTINGTFHGMKKIFEIWKLYREEEQQH